jgi:hypothetical protein
MGSLVNHQIALSHATIQRAWARITYWINVKLGYKNPVTISMTNEYPGLLREPGLQLVRFPDVHSPLSAQQYFTEHPCLSA